MTIMAQAPSPSQPPSGPVAARLTLAQLLERLDVDVLGHLDWPDTRRALRATEPPVTHEALTEALCLGDSASEHPVYDLLDVWQSFHRDVALIIGARIGADVALGGHGLKLMDYERAWNDAAAYHRDVLARRQRRSPASADADPAACDGWCVEPHGDAGEGFHHRGTATPVKTDEGPGREVGVVELRLSRFAPIKDSREQEYPVVVSIDWPQNAGLEDYTELTLDEAERLGRALLLKVADARLTGGAE